MFFIHCTVNKYFSCFCIWENYKQSYYEQSCMCFQVQILRDSFFIVFRRTKISMSAFPVVFFKFI